jgi:hypothetical protein
MRSLLRDVVHKGVREFSGKRKFCESESREVREREW